MKKKTSLLFILIILVLAACQPKVTATSPLSAAVRDLEGKVDIKQAGQDTFSSAGADSVLEVNGQIQTGDDGRVRLDLTSGTIIRVAPSSLFTLTSNDEVEGGLATKIKLELGKVFIILNGGTADVETPSGVASVRGSYMKVEVDSDTFDVYVTCLEGNCSAENSAGKVNFTEGEKTILFQKDPVTGNWTIPNVEPMTPEEFQEWLDENPEAKELFNKAAATMTALAKPTATVTATPTLVAAMPDAAASNSCFKAIQPTMGSGLPHQGKVKFEWESQPGAQKYVVTFINSDGNPVSFETTETSLEKFVEGFIPKPGNFTWTITAYGADGNAICTTEQQTFSKPDSFPQPPAPVNQDEDKPSCNPCDYTSSCYDPYFCEAY